MIKKQRKRNSQRKIGGGSFLRNGGDRPNGLATIETAAEKIDVNRYDLLLFQDSRPP